MNFSKISVRYARALFISALEEKKLDPVREDAIRIRETLKQSDEIREIMGSPVLETSSKIKGLEILFEGRIQELTMNFLRLVVKNRREEQLRFILLQYEKQYKEHKNIKLVKIRSAYPIAKAEQDDILDLVRGLYQADLEVETEINKDLIGGFIMQIEDQQIDASISMQLNRIREKLSGKKVKKL